MLVSTSEWFAISDATSELGEPAHLGSTPAKSIWFKWTAPVHGVATSWADRSLATNVMLAIYEGTAVQALRRLAGDLDYVQFNVIGGNTYYIAAAVPTNVVGDVLIWGGIARPSSDSYPVPGNLLREPSWEGTAIVEAQHWRTSGSVGGSVNSRAAPMAQHGQTWAPAPKYGRTSAPLQDKAIPFALPTSAAGAMPTCASGGMTSK